MRDKSIAVSEEEQEQLDEAAEALYGTKDVAYGAVISGLVQQFQSSAQSSNQSDT